MSRHARLADDRGGITVLFAVCLPLLVVVAAFVIDVANWMEHRRHLQLQADAGALAAAQEVGVVGGGCGAEVDAAAREYSGTADPSYNAQVAPTAPENVGFELNSSTYPFGQTDPVDPTVRTGDPCDPSVAMIDVKLAEQDLPWYFDLLGLGWGGNHINAHARVEFQQAAASSGALPVGVPDPNPKRVRVELLDESAGGAVIGGADLQKAGAAGSPQLWDNATAPAPIRIDTTRISMRVILSGGASTTCGEPLVECHDLTTTSPPRGIVHLRGWRDATVGAGQAPAAESVELVGSGCDPYFVHGGPCQVGMRATVAAGVAPANVRLTARVGNRTQPLEHAGGGVYQSAPGATFTVSPGAGPVAFELEWEQTSGTVGADACKSGGGNRCKGSFGAVQRSFGATASRSGPIELAQISHAGNQLANSLEACSATRPSCTYDLVFRIGVGGNLENAASVSDPVVELRVTGGSRNQSLDCDPALPNLKDELATGCHPVYALNEGTPCPAGNSGLWGTEEPWRCVGIQTGTAINQVPAGMNLRVYGAEQPASCPAAGQPGANNWSAFPDIPPGDPRLIQVFLTPFGSFGSSGSGTVPVTGFAAFYVTGWAGQGGGFSNPCQGAGDDPAEPGYIVGHFVKYVSALNNGSTGEPCDFSAFGPCVAVLTE